MSESQFLSVHCHYYQPPRGNPFSPASLVEADAAPYPNWNARITAECYEPNGRSGNYKLVSFNVGETLAHWLAEHAPDTYRYFIEADAENRKQFGVGNGIAQPMDHTILPLARRSDKQTQVRWGKVVFNYRFDRPTSGMWLPEMAVDTDTLEVLVDEGIEWTILTERQVEGEISGAGPYWVELPSGKRIKVFLRDESLSNDIAFNLGRFGGAGRWARQVLGPRKKDAGELTLIATDGETFGHHWSGEEQFLHWLLTYEAHAAGYEITSLARYAREVEPKSKLKLRENTSWSCEHGVARWSTGCSCTAGDSTWKGALRRAFDNLRFELDEVYLDEAKHLGVDDPQRLREAYIKVELGLLPSEQLLQDQEIDLPPDDSLRLRTLIEAQFYRQRMYSSCAFFFAELDSHSTHYGIANASYAIMLTQKATGTDLHSTFRRELAIARGNDLNTGQAITGADVYDVLQSNLNTES